MASSRIASRYSKSLFDLAQQNGELEQVKSDMLNAKAICASSRELTNLLRNPIVQAKDKKAVFAKVFSGFTKLSLDFINLLVEKRREEELPMVAEQFIVAYNELKGISRAIVVSASPLSDTANERIKAYVQGLLGSTDIELSNEIDASIIGGLVIKHNDRLLDMSVAKELREIRKELIYN